MNYDGKDNLSLKALWRSVMDVDQSNLWYWLSGLITVMRELWPVWGPSLLVAESPILKSLTAVIGVWFRLGTVKKNEKNSRQFRYFISLLLILLERLNEQWNNCYCWYGIFVRIFMKSACAVQLSKSCCSRCSVVWRRNCWTDCLQFPL